MSYAGLVNVPEASPLPDCVGGPFEGVVSRAARGPQGAAQTAGRSSSAMRVPGVQREHSQALRKDTHRNSTKKDPGEHRPLDLFCRN